MSIDARVKAVHLNEDGSGKLNLVDRPKSRPGDSVGCAGQAAFYFDAAPHEVTALNGLDVWGGANGLMLGDVEIAKREGYTRIVFVAPEAFKRAVRDYHKGT